MVETTLIWEKADGGGTVLVKFFMKITILFFMKNNDFMFNKFVKLYGPGSQDFSK